MQMDLLKTIQSLENDKLLSMLLKFNEIIQERDSEITLLRNKVADLEARVIEQEIYSSKDCLIIENLPIEDRNAPLSHQVCHFFKSSSIMRLVPTISRRAITWVSGKVIHFRQLFLTKKPSYWEESPGYPVKLINPTVILYISKNAYLDTRKRFLNLLKPKI